MEGVMNATERNERDENIEALAYALFHVLATDAKGCRWREIPEAIGLLLKLFATTLITTTDANQEEANNISTEMNYLFTEGYKRNAAVVVTK
jgi:hypothetical protein